MKRLLFIITLIFVMPAFCAGILIPVESGYRMLNLLTPQMSADTAHGLMRELAEVQQKYSNEYAKETEILANPDFLKEEAIINDRQVQAFNELSGKYMGGEKSHKAFMKMYGNEEYGKERRAIIEQYEQGLRALIQKYAPEVAKAKVDMEADMEAVRKKYREMAVGKEYKRG